MATEGVTTVRTIDTLKNSVDVLSLNNMVVSLRVPLKKTKIRVITKLVHQIRVYKKKTGTQEQIASNKKKSDRLLKEIEEIKKLDNDKAIKFALGNTKSLANVSSQSDLELKAMIRLATHKMITKEVEKWRSKHSDWKSLSAFLMQHTSRRLRKKKKIVKDESDKNIHNSDSDDRNLSINSNESKVGDISVDGTNVVTKSSNVKKKKESGGNVKMVKKNAKKEEMVSECINTDLVMDKDTDSCIVQDTISDSEGSEISSSDNGEDDELVSTDISRKEKHQSIYRDGEVVIKRINLDEIESDNQSPGEEKDVQFLFKDKNEDEPSSTGFGDTSEKEIEPSKTRKRRDDFFLGGDSESEEILSSESDMEDEETEESNVNFAKKKMMVESTFLGCLSTAGSKSGKKINKKDSISKKHQSNTSLQSWKPHTKQFSHSTERKNPKHLCVKGNRNDKDTRHRNYTKMSKRQNEKQNSNTEKKLHPSWEASMKRKQEQCALTKFEGKRITFDD